MLVDFYFAAHVFGEKRTEIMCEIVSMTEMMFVLWKERQEDAARAFGHGKIAIL